MKRQTTVPGDGSFSGHVWQVVTNAGDMPVSASAGQRGYQSPNDYTQYGADGMGVPVQTDKKNQLTQSGWDGSFIGIRIPSPLSTDGDNGGSQLGSFTPVSFSGFTGPNEASGPVGPNFSPSNGQPNSGSFPGDGTSSASFTRQNER